MNQANSAQTESQIQSGTPQASAAGPQATDNSEKGDLNKQPSRMPRVPLPENIRSVQPGGGKCYQIEMAWGRLRRMLLRTFRKGYVERMAATREGDASNAPHAILDPRDLKYCSNLCTAHWRDENDPFQWRSRLPIVRWGLAEAQLMGWPMVTITLAAAWLPAPWNWSALVPAVLAGLILYFFRNPKRTIPNEPNCLVSPADGKVVEITKLEHDEFVGGPSVRIGIFLSIFNVHINRFPERSRVVELRYHPGEFLNAMNPESALCNEAMWIGLESEEAPHRRMVVRQISGLIARRIVCSLRPGQVGSRGEAFGMIKLGSRTELIVPAQGLTLDIKIGQAIQAGSTQMGYYATETKRA